MQCLHRFRYPNPIFMISSDSILLYDMTGVGMVLMSTARYANWSYLIRATHVPRYNGHNAAPPRTWTAVTPNMTRTTIELQTKVRENFTITENPGRKTPLRHYAKRSLTPWSLTMKLGPRHNYHKAIRHTKPPVPYDLCVADPISC